MKSPNAKGVTLSTGGGGGGPAGAAGAGAWTAGGATAAAATGAAVAGTADGGAGTGVGSAGALAVAGADAFFADSSFSSCSIRFLISSSSFTRSRDDGSPLFAGAEAVAGVAVDEGAAAEAVGAGVVLADAAAESLGLSESPLASKHCPTEQASNPPTRMHETFILKTFPITFVLSLNIGVLMNHSFCRVQRTWFCGFTWLTEAGVSQAGAKSGRTSS